MTEKKNENLENEVNETPAQETDAAAENVAETKAEVVEEATELVEEAAVEANDTVEEVVAEEKAAEKEEVVAEETIEAAPETKEELAAEEKTEVAEKKPKTKAKETSAEPEEFDWASLEVGLDAYSESERDKLANLYNDTLNTVSEKEVLTGTVISLNKREVVVDIGYKSDGIVSVNEFRYNPELKIGDKVDVYIESLEDKRGQMILSHKQARATRSWDRVNEALDKDEIIKGYIKCRTKGGMIVDVFGIEAFLPGSQIDVKPIRDYDVFVGKTMEFKVVKINNE
jgi:small subunit ribosomal protein S1